MALTGSKSVAIGSYWKYLVEWSATQDIEKNTSTVTAKFYWVGTSSSYSTTYTTATKTGTATVGGTASSFSTTAKITGAEKKLVHTATKTITHAADGTASFAIASTFNIGLTLSGTTYDSAVIPSTTFTLNTIPRASSISSSLDQTAGTNFTVSVSRASTAFTHTADIAVTDSAGTYKAIKTLTFNSSTTSLSTGFTDAEFKNIFTYLGGAASRKIKVTLTTKNGSTTVGTATKEGTLTAPAASVVGTLSTKSFNTDTTFAIPVTRNNSSFTHTVNLIRSDNTTVLATRTGVTTSASFALSATEKTNFHNLMTKATSVAFRVQVLTYYSGVLVRSTTTATGFTMNVINALPTFAASTITYLDSNSTTVGITGNNQYIIQNNSLLKVTLPAASKATAQKGATITQYIASIGKREVPMNYATTDIVFDFGKVDVSTDTAVIIRAVDSRGNTQQIAKTIYFVPYAAPTISATALRKDGFSDPSTLSVKGTISPLAVAGTNKNTTVTVHYRYRKSTEADSVTTWASWTAMSSTLSGNSVTGTAVSLNLANSSQWIIDFKITDRITHTPVTKTIGQGQPILHVSATHKTVGINQLGTSSHELSVTGNAKVSDTLYTSLLNFGNNTGRLMTSGSINYLQIGTSTEDTVNTELRISKRNTTGTAIKRVGIYANELYVSGAITNQAVQYPSLLNSWVNYTAAGTTTGFERAGYYKDKNGNVFINGLVKGGAVGTVVFTLPSGYRPFATIMTVQNTNGAFARVDVTAAGEVKVVTAGYPSTWVSLSGICFKAV